MTQGQTILLLSALLLLSCSKQKMEESGVMDFPEKVLFERLSPDSTHLNFVNNVIDDKEFNIFNYRNFYNGGGVAIGDVNNDSLPDVFMVSNMNDNKLYLNKGNFQFEDITATAGVAGKHSWSTGVTFADVNADGWLDIYVCNSGNRTNDDRANELYINNKDLTFTESAAEYGLNDRGYSTHAAFFDYDRDGDLDMYLLNNSFIPIGTLQYANIRHQRDKNGGQKLFRNEGKGFKDVSGDAGIYGSVIGFGLGITVGDVNNDNWLDIYISNDFYERDYLYINNQDGTFDEASKDWMQHESLSSMGADIADIDNDGNLDIFVTDMLPWDDYRLKTNAAFEGYDLFNLKLSRDFHYQYMHNMLHLNNGNGTFSEVARLAGVHATDWSWGALLFDMDNDGWKDIFVANGIAKELTNQDFVNFLNDEATIKSMMAKPDFDVTRLVSMISSKPVPNYAFKNNGELRFENKAQDLGLGEPGFSNGAAYGDLDNDGDLDLIVNNVNMPSFVYKNNTTETLRNHYLRVKLKGSGKNTNGIGAKVYVHQRGQTLYLQQMPNRGFESSVDHTLVFGLGKNKVIDSLIVIWPDDKTQVIKNVSADTDLILNQKDAVKRSGKALQKEELPFTDVTQRSGLLYTHKEKDFVDFNRDGLIKQKFSTQGPALASADVNGDGLEDIYIGGASGNEKVIFLQRKDGSFSRKSQPVFDEDIFYEDVAASFFDSDNDGDQDLFVVTGSNEFEDNAAELLDRLYLNDGKGNFSQGKNIPAIAQNGSCVAPADFDKDGDIDLFIGGRMISGSYGLDAPSYLYINDGTSSFKNYTKRYLPSNELGMVTDALWEDLNHDGFPELIVVGDWMPITIFRNEKGRKLLIDTAAAIPNSTGWWNTIKACDIDGDGDKDFVVGNLGTNSRIFADALKPAHLYVNDFGQNGKMKQVITCHAEDGKAYPMVLKNDLQRQIPALKKRFLKHADFAGKQIQEIFSAEDLNTSVVKEVRNPETSLLINEGDLHFRLVSLPVEAQFSAIHAIEIVDCNDDSNPDIILTGNFFDLLPEMGRYDANYGVVMEGDGNGNFKPVLSVRSGFFSKGQVRRMAQVKNSKGESIIILAKNNDHVQVFSMRKL